MNTLHLFIIAITAWFSQAYHRFIYYCQAAAPPLFKAKQPSQAQTFLATVNQRRLRKRQRQASRAVDRFAFA